MKSAMKITETSYTAETILPAIEDVFYAEETPLLKFAFGYVKRREVAEEIVVSVEVKTII